jgi:hypothetical protein
MESMRRIRVTLQETKTGWKWIRQEWETPNGFSHKRTSVSEKKYIMPHMAVEALRSRQEQQDKEIYPHNFKEA